MGKVVVIEHLTLDGVMQGPGRPDEDRRGGFEFGGWAASAGGDPAMQQVLGARMGSAWSLLLGRITYQDFASHWPTRPRPNPMADALDNVQKFVASSTLNEPLPWRNSTLLNGHVVDAVTALKAERPETLVIFGSGVLVQSLMKRNLVDEFVLQIHPLVLGEGRHLFATGCAVTKLSLIDSVTVGTGVTIATYRPSGDS